MPRMYRMKSTRSRLNFAIKELIRKEISESEKSSDLTSSAIQDQ